MNETYRTDENGRKLFTRYGYLEFLRAAYRKTDALETTPENRVRYRIEERLEKIRNRIREVEALPED